MAEEQAWPEVPGLDDWYDNALKAGQGFKSDKEREDYIKSIGDPMMHPLFAENTEDLEGNPLAEALRALREEDKTPIEIATMYKDEGNDWLKKGDKKSMNEAYDRYSHALNILDRTASAATSGASSFNPETGVTEHSSEKGKVSSLYPEELLSPHQQQLIKSEEDSAKELEEEKLLKSQIYSNRALVSLNLKNFGSCVRDADSSILLWPSNIKAHYRKCKALGEKMFLCLSVFVSLLLSLSLSLCLSLFLSIFFSASLYVFLFLSLSLTLTLSLSFSCIFCYTDHHFDHSSESFLLYYSLKIKLPTF